MRISGILIVIIMFSCGEMTKPPESIELIKSINKQDSIFQNLVKVTNNEIQESVLDDSLAFLVLPVQASCPACRKKTIDSIIKHQARLSPNHFIIISAIGGRKLINGYFKEENSKLPDLKGRLFLDSTDQAVTFKLYDQKPTFYYTHKRKAYKKVAAVPSTVRQDLQEFFSGFRSIVN